MSNMHTKASETAAGETASATVPESPKTFATVTRPQWNLVPARLYEAALAREEGLVADTGAIVCRTGQHTGRSPNDKFIVRHGESASRIAWGKVNQALDPAQFDVLSRDIYAALDAKELFVLDAYAGADPEYRLPIRIITESAWHNLFARNLFIPETDAAKLARHTPQFTVVCVPSFQADPGRHGTRS